jgi:hypothetical protein
MKGERLNTLLERYYNGESSEEEEFELKAYFSGDEIPEGYETEKEIFGYYKIHNYVPEPSNGFEERIIASLDSVVMEKNNMNFRKLMIPFLSAAAGLIMLLGSYFFLTHRNEPVDTFSDPRIAYAETMKILINVSSKMNYGRGALEPVSKLNTLTVNSFNTINKSESLIKKNLKSLGYLGDADNLFTGNNKK